MAVPHLLFELQRTSAMLATAVDLRLKNVTGLPLVLFEPMTVIASRSNCRVHDLAVELGVSTGSASKLADRLEVRGYCLRRPNPGDRRSSLLELSVTGTALLATAERVVGAELDDLLGSCLSRAEVAELAAKLHELRAILRSE
jgi:DNA-binding MarR family transcriptional regulator